MESRRSDSHTLDAKPQPRDTQDRPVTHQRQGRHFAAATDSPIANAIGSIYHKNATAHRPNRHSVRDRIILTIWRIHPVPIGSNILFLSIIFQKKTTNTITIQSWSTSSTTLHPCRQKRTWHNTEIPPDSQTDTNCHDGLHQLSRMNDTQPKYTTYWHKQMSQSFTFST